MEVLESSTAAAAPPHEVQATSASMVCLRCTSGRCRSGGVPLGQGQRKQRGEERRHRGHREPGASSAPSRRRSLVAGSSARLNPRLCSTQLGQRREGAVRGVGRAAGLEPGVGRVASRSRNACSRRDLPRPTSPQISTTWPWRSCASSQRWISKPSSWSRPTSGVSAAGSTSKRLRTPAAWSTARRGPR